MLYGLIGEKLDHSFSKSIHQSILSYPYELWSFNQKQLINFLNNRHFKGVNITIPYKEFVLPYLDFIDPIAKEIGAVNTITIQNGKTIGHNTDYLGFEYLLSFYQISLKHKNIAILGTGGSAKTIAYVALKHQCKSLTFVSRTKKKNCIDYTTFNKKNNYDVIINTTPNGMCNFKSENLVQLQNFNNLEAVIDIIYNPLKTNLLIQAEKRKIKTASGLIMLVAQAFYADEIFLNQKLDSELIIKTYEKIFSELINVILIGMPGAGKSTISSLLSKKEKKAYISIDSEIEKKEHLKITDIFNLYGENYFREIESDLTRQISNLHGTIIATGGGIVLKESNIDELRKNGIIVFIDRGLDKIKLNDQRPLAKNYQDLKTLYQQRIDLYHQYCDLKIDNNLSTDQTLKKIKEAIYEYTHFKRS